MATALDQFRVMQVGIESTKGTAVAATKKIRGNFTPNEKISRYYSAYPQGYRANTGGVGVPVSKGFSGTLETELTFEEILWFLQTGLRGSVTAVGAGTDKTWTFDPELTTHPTLQTMTVEYTETDGTTNHVAREAAHVMTTSYKIDNAFNAETKFSAEVFGRYPAVSTPTSSLSVYANREIAVSNQAKVWVDTTWAGLGTTLLAGSTLRSATLEVTTGLSEDYTLDGRSDLDMTGYRVGLVSAKLDMVMELNAASAAIIGNWRAGDVRFVRLSNFGSLITGSIYKEVRHDLALRLVGDAPVVSTDGDYRNVAFSCETILDPTSGKTLVAVVVNKEGTL